MKLGNLIPLEEINFRNQKQFDDYAKKHTLRSTTKVTIAGKDTTAGQATKNPPSAIAKTGSPSQSSSKGSTNANLPNKASQLDYKHAQNLEKVLNAKSGLGGYAQIDSSSGAIIYNASKGDSPTYTLYMGSNDDYGKPDEFRVSLEPTEGNDPAELGDKYDKSFKSADAAAKYMIGIAKKHKKALQMDDESGSISEASYTNSGKLPSNASKLNATHARNVKSILNTAAGLSSGYAELDSSSGAITYNASKGEMPTYTLYMGSNDDYGKPDEFRVSLEPTYGEDPAKLGDKYDKTFKSADAAVAYMIGIAKKHKKELQMDDEA